MRERCLVCSSLVFVIICRRCNCLFAAQGSGILDWNESVLIASALFFILHNLLKGVGGGTSCRQRWVLNRVWNVMAHAQKPDFVFRRNGRVHLSRRGRQFSRLLAAEVVRISVSNVGYTMFRGSVKSTGYPFHSPVSPSLPLPCVTVCNHISPGL